jgi:hypothetical protein
MGLAHARRPEEDDVFAALDEAELVQALDLLAAERRLEGENKLREPFDGGESAGAHRRLEAPIVSELNLGVEPLLDRVRRSQRRAIDALQDRIQRFEGTGMRRSASIWRRRSRRDGGVIFMRGLRSGAHTRSGRASRLRPRPAAEG